MNKQVIHYGKTVFIRGMKGCLVQEVYQLIGFTFKIKGKKTQLLSICGG